MPRGISEDKVKDWGYHHRKYYSLAVQIIETEVDRKFTAFLKGPEVISSGATHKKKKNARTDLERLSESLRLKTEEWLIRNITYQ